MLDRIYVDDDRSGAGDIWIAQEMQCPFYGSSWAMERPPDVDEICRYVQQQRGRH